MRCLVGFVFVFGALAGPAPSASAQTDQVAKLDQRVQLALIPQHLQQRLPAHRYKRPPPKEAPPDPPMSSEEKKVRNAKIGLGVSSGLALVGVVMTAAASGPFIDFSDGSSSDSGGDAVIWVGVAVACAGAASMIATGILLGVRKRNLRRHEEERDVETPRVQWDLGRSRLVF
jgi:hypothetical protein